ncbi:pseudaminic acid biosynthesis-associated methylase [Aliarcobacter butzleri]|uniref:pseudaminic acid biosynthesis-associated methylase n=1 Tax=Aliarcobacter butzleri TaxID=28197 RepID=UPI003B2223AA
MKTRTNQEQFWKGSFGDEYSQRVDGDDLIKKNEYLFSKIFTNSNIKIDSILEFGANIGLNLKALQNINDKFELSAIEINSSAVSRLRDLNLKAIYEESILNFETDYKRDLVFTKTVLIHINPKELQKVYQTLYESSKKYILIIEYYNPTPTEVEYRGYSEKLFKRDFAGELLDKFKDLQLLDYGFMYKRDLKNPMDDLTWFLLEKKGN